MKIKNYILALILVLSFGLLAETKLTELPEIKYETLNINGNKNYKIIKPIFIDNNKFGKINDEINGLLDQKVLEDENKEACSYDPEGCASYEVISEPVIEYQDKDIISLSINTYVYYGGAHGMSGTESIIINRKTGENITNKILDSKKDPILKKIYSYVLKNPKEIFFSKDMITESCVLVDCPVIVKTGKDAVQIRYGQYALASYADGEQVFEYNTKTGKLYYFDQTGEKENKLEVK
ncbi:MAG: DUF4163 domain-containing protein [Sebaldella sp.]|nr:DUF4163 domain-containing protein [Sebaldella sp.]